MEQLPVYISVAFVLTTLLTLLLFWKASNHSRQVIALLSAWLIIQMAVGLSEFYTVTDSTPPRFLLLVLPPLFLIFGLFISQAGKRFIDSLSLKRLILLHVVRIPVELILFLLFLNKVVPQEMTFEGSNFDIICGVTAPLVYFMVNRQTPNRKLLLAWNIICLLLLFNIVATAILSAPFSFQRFGFDQPNVALLYFPYLWLPGFIVPIVLFSHLAMIRQLISSKMVIEGISASKI